MHEIHFMGIIVDSWKFWDWSRCSLRKSFAQRIKFYNSVLESAWTTKNTTFSNLQAKNNDKLWTKRSRREMLDKIIEKWVINDYLSLHCRQSWVIHYWQAFFLDSYPPKKLKYGNPRLGEFTLHWRRSSEICTLYLTWSWLFFWKRRGVRVTKDKN